MISQFVVLYLTQKIKLNNTQFLIHIAIKCDSGQVRDTEEDVISDCN